MTAPTEDQPGVWIVADTWWGDEGPGETIPYATKLEALQAVNDAGWQRRAWFVPFGKELREVMNERR